MGDRFVKEFENKTTIPIINGAKVLVPERDKYNFYRKYDTHWSNLGAFFVVAELIKRIKEDFPNITIMDTSLFTITPYELKGGNMKRTAKDKEDMDFGFDIAAKNKTAKRAKGYVHKVMEEFRYGQGAYCIRYKSNNTKSPKALIIRDSYCNYTTDFLPEMFSETLYIWDDWKYTFNKEIVDIEKPDLIVYSIFEGYIDRLLMNPSFVKKDKADDDVQ